jgi:hypothetical protein
LEIGAGNLRGRRSNRDLGFDGIVIGAHAAVPVLTTLRLILLAKIGLLWYEINDFSNAKKPTVLRTAARPKWIGAGCLVLAKTQPVVFYCQMRHAELENSVFSQVNSLFDQTPFPVPMQNREIMATHWDYSTNRSHQNGKNFVNSLYLPDLRESADQAARVRPHHPAPINRTASSRSNR